MDRAYMDIAAATSCKRHHVIFNIVEYIRFKRPAEVTLFAAGSIGRRGEIVETVKTRKLKFTGGTFGK